MNVRYKHKPNEKIEQVVKSISQEQDLLYIQRTNEYRRDFKKEIYEQGTGWAFSGRKLEDADKKLSGRRDFCEGYKRGLRMIKYGLEREEPKKR